MRSLVAVSVVVFSASLGASVAAQTPPLSATPWTSSSLDVGPVWGPIQRYPVGPRLSESQRRGMRLGAQIGIFAGLAVALVAAAPDEDCAAFECVGQAGAWPIYVGVGLLGGMIAGGAVGLLVGTIVDDEGEAQSTVGLSVRMRAP